MRLKAYHLLENGF